MPRVKRRKGGEKKTPPPNASPAERAGEICLDSKYSQDLTEQARGTLISARLQKYNKRFLASALKTLRMEPQRHGSQKKQKKDTRWYGEIKMFIIALWRVP